MPKLRLHIAHREIVMKSIISVVVSGIKFYRDEYKAKDSRVLVGFYNFVRRNVDKLEFIEYDSNDAIIQIYLKNCKIHNEYGPAYIQCSNNLGNVKYYCLENNHMPYNEWIVERNYYLRKDKLKRLNER